MPQEEKTTRSRRPVSTAVLLLIIAAAMAGVALLVVRMMHYSASTTIQSSAPQQETVTPSAPPAEPEEPAVQPAEPAQPVEETPPSEPAAEEQPSEEVPVEEPPAAEPAEKTYAYAAETDDTRTLDLELYSAGAILIDAETNTVICEKDPDAKIYPASMTKILTALVACEQIEDLDDTFRMTQAIIDPIFLADATMAGFVDGEDVPLRELIYGAILPSGAEATEALAIYVAGSEEAYAELMNEKAQELGLTTAHFVDASGLHNEQHYCTIRDMAVILQAALDNDLCREVLSTARYTTPPTNKHPDGVEMINKFLVRAEGQELHGAQILAAKTGYTAQAGNCCASYGVSPKGRKCICVTANAWTSWYTVYDHVALYSQYAD